MAASKKDVAKQQVKEDREKVREMYLSGKTVKEIAKETYFSSSYCYAMVRDLAKEKNLAKKAKRAPLDEAMIQDAKAGMTVAEIAKKHGVTYQQCYAKRTPCVLCVDEIDAIGMCRGSRDDVAEMSRVTIALMQELDRLPNDVILIGTTNRVDNLDEALIRRFTFKHRVKPLGDDDMKELCKKFLASADYPFTESELDELCHSLREQRTASAVVNACTERIVAHVVSQLPENSADAV